MNDRAAHLEATRPLVEATIGRRLRLAEQKIDVLGVTRELTAAKDELDTAIKAEQKRAVDYAIATSHTVALYVTKPMLKPLERLYLLGQTEALHELVAIGVTPRRRMEHQHERSDIPELAPFVDRLKIKLNGLSVKLQIAQTAKLVQLQTTAAGTVADALATALINVQGGRAIAADLVSPTLFAGMGATFEENSDLVGQWEYSSVLDGGTCDVCAPMDGVIYDTWEDVQADLPNGGPNPSCLGGDRCRCRAVPR